MCLIYSLLLFVCLLWPETQYWAKLTHSPTQNGHSDVSVAYHRFFWSFPFVQTVLPPCENCTRQFLVPCFSSFFETTHLKLHALVLPMTLSVVIVFSMGGREETERNLSVWILGNLIFLNILVFKSSFCEEVFLKSGFSLALSDFTHSANYFPVWMMLPLLWFLNLHWDKALVGQSLPQKDHFPRFFI